MKKSFEESLRRLEEITSLLENGGIELKESLELFSEGTELIADCEKYLDEAELKIKKLFNGGATDEL